MVFIASIQDAAVANRWNSYTKVNVFKWGIPTKFSNVWLVPPTPSQIYFSKTFKVMFYTFHVRWKHMEYLLLLFKKQLIYSLCAVYVNVWINNSCSNSNNNPLELNSHNEMCSHYTTNARIIYIFGEISHGVQCTIVAFQCNSRC